MISYLLVVFAMTANGPVAQPIAAFENYQLCVRVAQGIVPKLRQQLQTDQVAARCIERTDI